MILRKQSHGPRSVFANETKGGKEKVGLALDVSYIGQIACLLTSLPLQNECVNPSRQARLASYVVSFNLPRWLLKTDPGFSDSRCGKLDGYPFSGIAIMATLNWMNVHVVSQSCRFPYSHLQSMASTSVLSPPQFQVIPQPWHPLGEREAAPAAPEGPQQQIHQNLLSEGKQGEAVEVHSL